MAVVDDDADTGVEGGEPPRSAGTLAEWRAGRRLPREVALLVGLVLPALLLAANMWRVHAFTVDDGYISFRYARNLARGLGLVYNEGERVEGYTNFLWTVLLAGGIRLGIDPALFSKLLGAASAFGSLALVHALSARLQPVRTLPCVATWLLASSIVTSGYAVFGLETVGFVFLVLAGTLLFFREADVYRLPGEIPPARLPWSGLVFAAAGLTRPEAPMFIGLLMLLLGRRFFSRQNLVRALLFAGPVALHLAFRRLYYGSWVPNTLGAKTGNLAGQMQAGLGYLGGYLAHAGPVLYLALLGVGLALSRRRRDLLAVLAMAIGVIAYVALVGGDWMKYFRFLAPLEPFLFVLVCVGLRRAVDRRDAATNVAVALFAAAVVHHRGTALRAAQDDLVLKEKRFWDMAAGGTAEWLVKSAPRGEIAMGDIGYIGWVTDYPVLDLLGLVDPVIAKLPGGYTQKLGPGYNERFFEKKPRYALIISAGNDCQHPSVPGSTVLYRDPRFQKQYELGGRVKLDDPFSWCVYKRRP